MRKYLLYLVLFAITIFSTTLAGAEWIFGRSILRDPTGQTTIFENWTNRWFTWAKFYTSLEFPCLFCFF